jgi:hypothetical protein
LSEKLKKCEDDTERFQRNEVLESRKKKYMQ